MHITSTVVLRDLRGHKMINKSTYVGKYVRITRVNGYKNEIALIDSGMFYSNAKEKNKFILHGGWTLFFNYSMFTKI